MYDGLDEPFIGRIVAGAAGGRDDRHLGEAAVGILRLSGRRLKIDLVGSGEELGDQMVEKGDEKRRRAVVVGQRLGGDLSACEGGGDGGPELIGRRVPPLVDRLFPVSHEKDRPFPLGILPHGAEDILDQRPEQVILDLRRVLELVEEQMGRPVEPQFVEARHEERPVGAVGPVEGDERLGDIVEIEPAESFLLFGEHFGAQGAEALEKGAPQPFGVDEMLGDEAAHRGIELPQGGVGGSPAVGGGHLDLRQIGFEEEGPFEIHLGERFEEGVDHLRAQGSPSFPPRRPAPCPATARTRRRGAPVCP